MPDNVVPEEGPPTSEVSQPEIAAKETASQVDANEVEAAEAADTDEQDLIPDAASLNEAQAEARDLLHIVEVTRVICVDDEFAGTVDDLKAVCEDLQSDATVSRLDDVTFDVPPEIWRQAVDARWVALTDTERAVALADAREKAGHLETDQLNAGALWSVLPAEVEFIALTPDEWVAGQENYVAEATVTPTLVLFDKDLGGGHDGLALVISLYATDSDRRVWGGLFTHTTDIANEHAAWATHAATPGVEADRFIVLSKQHMGPNPGAFPQALKVALMTRPASVLRRAVSDAIRQQMDVALDELDTLSPAAFERLVFGLTREEGQWEVDMLLRLFDAFLRSDVRQVLHGDPEVRAGILVLRKLAAAVTLPTENTTKAQEIYRRELYEEAGHLNSLHLPLELGDIFTTSNDKNFILVLQPCDLMVRADGARHPDLQNAGLVEILDRDPNTSTETSTQPTATGRELLPTFELPAFKDGASAWARLDRAYMVPIEALDFCIFDPDGKANAPTVGGAPDWLLPGWARRYERLASTAASITTALNPLVNAVTADNRRRIAASHYGRVRSVAKISLTDTNTVRFDLQRTARLRNPRASALLTRFSAHVARDAFERAIV